MADDLFRLPPSPCSSCFHGPSGRCQRPYGLKQGSGGCRIWTEWFMENWPKVCRALQRRMGKGGRP